MLTSDWTQRNPVSDIEKTTILKNVFTSSTSSSLNVPRCVTLARSILDGSGRPSYEKAVLFTGLLAVAAYFNT